MQSLTNFAYILVYYAYEGFVKKKQRYFSAREMYNYAQEHQKLGVD